MQGGASDPTLNERRPGTWESPSSCKGAYAAVVPLNKWDHGRSARDSCLPLLYPDRHVMDLGAPADASRLSLLRERHVLSLHGWFTLLDRDRSSSDGSTRVCSMPPFVDPGTLGIRVVHHRNRVYVVYPIRNLTDFGPR